MSLKLGAESFGHFGERGVHLMSLRVFLQMLPPWGFLRNIINVSERVAWRCQEKERKEEQPSRRPPH